MGPNEVSLHASSADARWPRAVCSPAADGDALCAVAAGWPLCAEKHAEHAAVRHHGVTASAWLLLWQRRGEQVSASRRTHNASRASRTVQRHGRNRVLCTCTKGLWPQAVEAGGGRAVGQARGARAVVMIAC